jgi:hypothetical protein
LQAIAAIENRNLLTYLDAIASLNQQLSYPIIV